MTRAVAYGAESDLKPRTVEARAEIENLGFQRINWPPDRAIALLAPARVVWFVPFDTGFRPLGVQSDLDVSAVVATPLPNPLHATIFWGYVLAALALGTFLLVRRDVD